MNSIDYKALRHSSLLLGLKEHKAQKTFYGDLFTSFPLSFQIDNIALDPFKNELPKVKELPIQTKEEAFFSRACKNSFDGSSCEKGRENLSDRFAIVQSRKYSQGTGKY